MILFSIDIGIVNLAYVILAVNDKSIGSVSDVIKVINEGLHKVGDFITLGVLRKEKMVDIELELMSKKEEVFY